ncbi:MAG: YHS domain-containing protein [Deltaproteobacteria bacterium]|nr:YHS domain-containing protein [Deltaproteobacteria bacterium]MBW2136882.1 YHS domain-containing protein [Deltaproteobacteria bacterium]
MKLLIYVLLGYVLYRVFKAFLGPAKRVDRGKPGGVIDEMVQDPFCNTYIPRRDSVRRDIEGQEYFFCSEECASRFSRERMS